MSPETDTSIDVSVPSAGSNGAIVFCEVQSVIVSRNVAASSCGSVVSAPEVFLWHS